MCSVVEEKEKAEKECDVQRGEERKREPNTSGAVAAERRKRKTGGKRCGTLRKETKRRGV
jgi:hypothetical protein